MAATMRRASQDQILVDVTAFPQDRREARTGGTLLAHATEGQVSDERRAPDLALAGREAALLPPIEKPLCRCHHVSLGRNATTCGRLVKNVIRARKGNIVNEPKKQKNRYIGKRRREEEGDGVVKDVGSQSVRDFVMLTCSQCSRVFLQSSNLAHLGFPTTLSHLRRHCTTIDLLWHCERQKRKTNLSSAQAASAPGGWT